VKRDLVSGGLAKSRISTKSEQTAWRKESYGKTRNFKPGTQVYSSVKALHNPSNGGGLM